MGVCNLILDVMAPEAHQNDHSYVHKLSKLAVDSLFGMVSSYTVGARKPVKLVCAKERNTPPNAFLQLTHPHLCLNPPTSLSGTEPISITYGSYHIVLGKCLSLHKRPPPQTQKTQCRSSISATIRQLLVWISITGESFNVMNKSCPYAIFSQ